MELGLFQQQTLKLVMTTELRQAITLLQYSALDLSEFLQEQSMENPLIELRESTWEQQRNTMRKSSSGNDVSPLDFATEQRTSLSDELLTQARWLELSEQERETLEHLIFLLDENGYLHEHSSDIAERLNRSESQVEEMIKRLQQLDPIGIGARSLAECLYLQLEYEYPDEELAAEIVRDHLQLLAEKKWKQITKQYDITLQEVQRIYDLLQTLNPRPGAMYNAGSANYIIPELTVKQENGTFTVSFNDQSIPTVSLNAQYKGILEKAKEEELSKYLQDKYQQIVWLQKSIQQRRLTLLKVMTAIIEKQPDFFEKGDSHLKPMTLRDIAEETELHESTVSRATTGKYVQTPHGVFELKSFFSSGIRTQQGEDASSNEVKIAMKKLIDSEDKKKPLSDQKIVQLLKEEHGVVASRRTIAKYRDQLNIPSSTKRKRYE
ncbi:RNA polymerase factor sigma-54 [Bacillus tianshenii]|nr:RNA polymerase factor sigma-54 [Bacillus tianshenii]